MYLYHLHGKFSVALKCYNSVSTKFIPRLCTGDMSKRSISMKREYFTNGSGGLGFCLPT